MMRRIIKKLFGKKLLILTIVTLLLVSFVNRTYAQGLWFQPLPEEHEALLEECNAGNVGLECTVHAVYNGILNAMITSGRELPCEQSRTPGVFHYASAIISKMLAKPPISSGEYVQYIAQKLDVPQAFAQGTGYQALRPLIPIWTAFRNLAYLVYVIIFIFIGFMIMFRAQLDPQTVVNIQNSLPKLIITLILITFSYAIAGFMVDLIYLGIFLVVAIFASQGLLTDPVSVRDLILEHNVFQLIFTGGVWRISDTAGDAIETLIRSAISDVTFSKFLGSIANNIAQAIFLVALIFSLFKLLFQLLIAYIQIIIATIFSPLSILFNALPGSQSFGNWIRNFLANILLFPAVATILLVAAVLMGPLNCQGKPADCGWGEDPWQVTDISRFGEESGWLPPFIGFTTDTDSVIALIGFGFILFTPQMVTVLKESLKAKPMPIAGIFAPIAAGARVVTSPAKGISGALTTGARVYFGEKVERIARRGEGAPPSQVG